MEKTGAGKRRQVQPLSMTVRLGGRRMTLTWRPRKRVAVLLRALLTRSMQALAAAALAGLPHVAAAQVAPQVAAGALPTGGQVVAGQALISQLENQMRITQSSNRAILDWNTFNIGSAARVDFVMPSSTSAVLNRVITNNPSSLLGTLTGNGRVWLVNPAGIMVGPGASIDVGGFIGSTLNIRNEDFLANRLSFSGPGALLRNEGRITTPQGGNVYLVGASVENRGLVTAPGGEVLLAAGQTVEIGDTATPGVRVAITGTEGSLVNMGQVLADAGNIGLAGVLVRNSGTLNASSVVNEGGRIYLRAAKSVVTEASSEIQASGTKGGDIRMIGEESGHFDGAIVARGSQGRGGFVETSGRQAFSIARGPELGAGGEWLIDPANISIRAAEALANVNTGPGGIASTGDDAIVTVDLLQNALNAGTNVNITTTATAGTQAGDINILSSITKSQGSDATLTLNAQNDINLQAAIVATGGKLNLALNHAGTAQLSSLVALNDGRLDSNGRLVFTGATLQGVNLTTSGSGSLSTLVKGGVTTLGSGTTWINNGVIDFLDAGALTLAQSSTFKNAAGASINLSGFAMNTVVSQGGTALNQGTVNKLSAGLSQLDAFSSSGEVNVQQGKLVFTGGGDYSGSFKVRGGASSDTTLAFAPGAGKTATLANIAIAQTTNGDGRAIVEFGSAPLTTMPVSTEGVGTQSIMPVDSAGTTLLNADLGLDNVILSAGTLAGSGKLAAGSFTWSGGSIKGGSVAPAWSVARLTQSGQSTLDGRVLNLESGGRSTIAGSLDLRDGAQLNLAGALSLADGARLGANAAAGTGSGRIVNTGQISVSNSPGASALVNQIGSYYDAENLVNFNNAGSVSVSDGLLALGPGNHNGRFETHASAGRTTELAFGVHGSAGGITNLNTGISFKETVDEGGSSSIMLARTNSTTNMNADLALEHAGLEGGLLQGAGRLTATNFNWNVGTIAGANGAPSIRVQNLQLPSIVLLSGRTLELSGASTANRGQLLMENGARLENSGTLDLLNGSLIGSTGNGRTAGSGSILNTGVINSGGTSPTVINAIGGGSSAEAVVRFNNEGTVNVKAGSLQLGGGEHTGAFNLYSTISDATTILRFMPTEPGSGAGTVTLAKAATITEMASATGATRVIFGSRQTDGIAQIEADLSLNRVGLESGVLQGAGTFSANRLDWSGGSIRAAHSDDPAWNIGRINLSALVTLDGRSINLGNGSGSSTASLNAGINLAPGAAMLVKGNHQLGALYNQGMISVRDGTLGATTVSNDGSVQLASTGTLASSAGFTNNAPGTISGNGAIDTGTLGLQNAGRLAPGSSGSAGVGVLKLKGGLAQSATGVIELDVLGTQAGEYDQVNVTGNVSLAGTVQASFQGAYVPAVGDAVPFLLASGTRSGIFDTVIANSEVQAGYNLYSGEATRLTAVPVSATTRFFNNSQGDYEWSTARNWTDGRLPGTSDEAIIDSGYDVRHSSGADTIDRLTIQSQNSLNVNGGSLTVKNATLVNGLLVTNDGGRFVANGSLGGSGTLSVNGGDMVINGATNLTSALVSGGSLTTNGAALFDSFSVSGGKYIANAANTMRFMAVEGGSFTSNASATVDDAFMGGGEMVLNGGATIKSMYLSGGRLAGAGAANFTDLTWEGGKIDADSSSAPAWNVLNLGLTGHTQLRKRSLNLGAEGSSVALNARLDLEEGASLNNAGSLALLGGVVIGGNALGSGVVNNTGSIMSFDLELEGTSDTLGAKSTSSSTGGPNMIGVSAEGNNAVRFNNQGTVSVIDSKLQLGAGTHGGSFFVQAGTPDKTAVLAFANDSTAAVNFNGDSSLSEHALNGAQTRFEFGSRGGETNLNVNALMTNAALAGGTLQGSGALTVTNMDWSGGTIKGVSTDPAYSFTNLVASNALKLENRALNLAPGGANTLPNASTLALTAGASLLTSGERNFGLIDNAGSITVQGGALATPALYNNGLVQVTSGGRLQAANLYSNTGTTIVDSGVLGAATIENAGSLQLHAAGTATAAGTLTNTGAIDIRGGTLNAVELNNLNSLQLSGGTINASELVRNRADARLWGTGTINTGTLVSVGKIAPGGTGAPGTLAINGSLLLGTTSGLEIEASGAAAGQFDRLDVSGLVALDGALSLTRLNGYAPAVGDAFAFITTGGSRSGTFSSSPHSLQVGYSLFSGEAARLTMVPSGVTRYFNNGAGNFSWSDARNWSDRVLPASTDDVYINAGSAVLHASGTDFAGKLTLASALNLSGGSLSVGGATTLNGNLNLSGSGNFIANGTVGGSGRLNVAGGSAVLNAATSLPTLVQTGGMISGTGSLEITQAVTETAGSINMPNSSIVLRQSSGNLTTASVTANSVAMIASAGAIMQTGSLQAALLSTSSTAGTVLENAGNRIRSFQASNAGSGNVSLTNTSGSASLSLAGVANLAPGGNVSIDNTGGIVNTTQVSSLGSVKLVAHSPITVNAPISAGTGVNLQALASTAGGDNLTINSSVSTTSGSLALLAGNALSVSASGSLSVPNGSSISLTSTNGAVTIANPASITGATPSVTAPGSTPTPPVVTPTPPVVTPATPTTTSSNPTVLAATVTIVDSTNKTGAQAATTGTSTTGSNASLSNTTTTGASTTGTGTNSNLLVPNGQTVGGDAGSFGHVASSETDAGTSAAPAAGNSSAASSKGEKKAAKDDSGDAQDKKQTASKAGSKSLPVCN